MLQREHKLRNNALWITTVLVHLEESPAALGSNSYSLWAESDVFSIRSIDGNRVLVGPSIINQQELGVQGSGTVFEPDTLETLTWVFHKAREKFLNEKPGHKFNFPSYDLQLDQFYFNKADLSAELVGPGVENEQEQKTEIIDI